MADRIDRIALGARLKEAREYQGFSQEEVARYLGISRSAISLVESGSRGLDTLELKKLASLYRCSINQLTGSETTQEEAEADSIGMVARATAELSPDDRSEVLRFVEFLKSRRTGKE